MLTPSRVFQALLRRAVRLLGLELVQRQQVPERSLAGLNRVEYQLVFDIGANRGDFIRYAQGVFRFREMHCFEPLEEPFRELQTVASTYSQPGKTIHAHPVALGEENGETVMHFHSDHSVSSSLLAATDRTGELFPQSRLHEQRIIRQARLDDYVRQTGIVIRSPFFIKMDVQGFEDRVIQGGREVVAKADLIMLEINFEQLYQGQASFRQLFDLLDELQFSYQGNVAQLYSDDGRILSADCLFYGPRFSSSLSI